MVPPVSNVRYNVVGKSHAGTGHLENGQDNWHAQSPRPSVQYSPEVAGPQKNPVSVWRSGSRQHQCPLGSFIWCPVWTRLFERWGRESHWERRTSPTFPYSQITLLLSGVFLCCFAYEVTPCESTHFLATDWVTVIPTSGSNCFLYQLGYLVYVIYWLWVICTSFRANFIFGLSMHICRENHACLC